MNTAKNFDTTIKKEMGITHNDFYAGLPALLNGESCQQKDNTIRFQFNDKPVEIILGAEGIRKIGPSIQLPVTLVSIRLFSFSPDEIDVFIRHFNLKFMKGGG